MKVYNTSVNRFEAGSEKPQFSGSGGGTRTPDTRIMIPTVSEEYQSLDCKQASETPHMNQIDGDGGVNENAASPLSRETRDYHCFSCGGRSERKGGHESCPDWRPRQNKQPIWHPGEGHLYFIGCESGPIKIGRSQNPKSRLVALQVSSPQRLTILAIAEECGGMEGRYHKRFAAHRLHGEWFDRHPDILAEIVRINNAGPKRGCNLDPALSTNAKDLRYAY